MLDKQSSGVPGEPHAPQLPPEFRRKVLDLVESGRKVAEVAQLLGISDQTIYTWRRRQRIDTGQEPGISSADHAELAPARRYFGDGQS